jgi:hypothetical protein
LVERLGCELPSPALVDAIWRAADLRVPPHLMIRSHDGIHMDTPELAAAQAKALGDFVGDRSLGVDFRLVAGAFKDVVMVDGKPGLYGWHADDDAAATLAAKPYGIKVHAPVTPGDGRVVQPLFTGHVLAWRDYSQGVRLVRRA